MKKRILTVALVAALLATCFAGTYAYLQDSEAQTNTFTTGNVYITLDEAKVVKDEATGNLVADGTTRIKASKEEITGQEYKLYPAMKVTKDPTITLDAGSEDAWIAAKITFTGYNAYELITGGVLKTDAVELAKDGDVVYVYVKAVKSAENKIVLFDTLTIPTGWDNAEMDEINGMIIDVEAYAVQAYGFADCVTAMQTAFEGAFPKATSTPAN